jgi:plasmid maintenance system antidote protein VapI
MTDALINEACRLRSHRDRGDKMAAAFAVSVLAECQRRNITQKQFAAEIGVSDQYINDVVKARRLISNAMLARIIGA